MDHQGSLKGGSIKEILSIHEIKRCLLLGRKAMTNLDSVLKSRDITLLTKVLGHMVVPVVVQMEELDCKEG